jgi:hypothetical protein
MNIVEKSISGNFKITRSGIAVNREPSTGKQEIVQAVSK